METKEITSELERLAIAAHQLRYRVQAALDQEPTKAVNRVREAASASHQLTRQLTRLALELEGAYGTTGQTPDAHLIEAAITRYESEGEIEIDRECAVVSRCDDPKGAYVSAWVWVQEEEIEEEVA